ncbi:hypothetical protein AK88_02482 [Plasmodium fragile]|uniref:Uncharacterized protein n=1 Tax=Plasmodium fragile TaxID=5857 RepID=A0A0D9QLQ1_PLAFR|nr:uncharacterized protein AK88_02482 [Plasmodium fragile]KJP87878.1 hypothetical protein AK88_02482 [Plasmodium fragile]
MKQQGGSFNENDKGEMGAAVEVVTAWERTKEEIDQASPRREQQQVRTVSQEDYSNDEPPYSVITQLAYQHGGPVTTFLTPPDEASTDFNPWVNDSPCGITNKGHDVSREGEGIDGPSPYLLRSYGSDDEAWKSTRESSDDVGGVHHEGGTSSSDEEVTKRKMTLLGEVGLSNNAFLRGEMCPSNDACLPGEDRAGEEGPRGESLDEREKRMVYKKADEIINGDSGGGEDWLLSESEGNEPPSGEGMQQSGVQRRSSLDRRALNLSAKELHAFLKRDKYHLTKMKTRMRNVVYRYLYERARGRSQPGEKETMSREASSMARIHTLEAETTDVASSSEDMANLLYTECTIRKTKIAQLRSVSKLVCDRRNEKCMRIVSYKNVYLFDACGCCSDDGSTGDVGDVGEVAGGVCNVPPRKREVIPQRPLPTYRFTCNNHFVCLQRKDNEVHVFSHRVLSLNESIFFKNKESKTTNEEELKKFLNDLTCSGVETNCKRVKLNWEAYPFYIIRDSSWNKIKSIHLNASNHLCVCTETGSFVYQLYFTNGTIQIKFSGSHLYRSVSVQKENEVLEAYLSSEKKMVHVSHYALFLLQRNSKFFKGDLFTLIKHIKCRQRILSVSFCGDWIILSFHNRVSVHYKVSGKVHFIVQINSQGDVVGAEVRQEAVQVHSPRVSEATKRGIPEPTHHIPLLCPLQGDNLFCLSYGRKISILEYSNGVILRKQFQLNHSVQFLKVVRNNMLVTYGEKELHVFQLVCVKKEFSLLFFFNKAVSNAKCSKIHEEGKTFESYAEAIKVKVKLIKINRDDQVARRIFYALNGDGTKGTDATSEGGAHFYVNLLYIYILNGDRVDLVVVNSLVYLIYLLFSHHRYGLLLALMLHLYEGNCCTLTDFPLDEEDRREKLKPLFYFLFEARMNDIIKNGNRFGRDPRNSIYHVQVEGGQCDKEGEGRIKNASNELNNVCSRTPSHTSNHTLESVNKIGSSSESSTSASVDQAISASTPVALNDKVLIGEGEVVTEWPSLPSPQVTTPHGRGTTQEEGQPKGGQLVLNGRMVSHSCIKELQKLCLLGIEISIKFNTNLHECIFELLRKFGAENLYFHLIEDYILRKRIGITHHSLVYSLTEHFKRLYRMFSECDDSCYDLFLFFCGLVGGAFRSERLNDRLNERRLSEVVFSPVENGADSNDDIVDRCYDDGCADLDVHLYRHHLAAQNIWAKIRIVYAFVCTVEMYSRLFEGIILEGGDMESIISHLPIHLSAFIYNKHNEDRITTAEFFISYLIRKKNKLFYSYCRCNNLKSDELPIYLPMYMYKNFYHSYVFVDYVFSIMFKIPFSISLNRFSLPLEEGITLKSCYSDVDASYQFDDSSNYKNVFFIFSPFRVERENHCTLNRTILSLWRYLLDGTNSCVGKYLPMRVASGCDKGTFLEFLSCQGDARLQEDMTCAGKNDQHKINLNDYSNLDKNGMFLLLQLSLKDTFYILNRSFFQYNFAENYNIVNLLIRNLCIFYLHMVITFLFYVIYLKKILRHNLSEETCVQIYKEVITAVNSCKDYDQVNDVCLRLVHVIEKERHTHVQKNFPRMVRWITLQLFYIKRHRKEMANSITYLLILFFILQSDCNVYSFDYLLGVYFVNFLLRLSCGGGRKEGLTSSWMGRRRFGKFMKRCLNFSNKNYLNKIRPHVKEQDFLRTFHLKEINLRVKKSQIKKNVEGTSSPQDNLVNYLLRAAYNVDVSDLLRQHGGDEYLYQDGRDERTGVSDEGEAVQVTRDEGCAFKRVGSGRSLGGTPSGGVPTREGKTRKAEKTGDIFRLKFCRMHYGYILLLYVKRLLVLHRGGRSPGGEKRDKSNPSHAPPTSGHAQICTEIGQRGRLRRNVDKLLKYILLFSHVRKCEQVYLVILNHFGRYDVVLNHYRARREWRNMQAYIFVHIFFFFKERNVKRRLRGYLFYADVLQHMDMMSDVFVNYILGTYFVFHNSTVKLLRGGQGDMQDCVRSVVPPTATKKGDLKKKSPWGKTHILSLCKVFTTTLIKCRNLSDVAKRRVYYLLLYEARMPSRIQRYLHKKIFYAYLTLLCKYKKDHVYRCVKYVNVYKYKELFERHENVNVLLHLHERQGNFLTIIDLCLKLIKQNILKLKNAFSKQKDWHVPEDVTYGDVYSVRFCTRVDIYNLCSMPLKRSVRRIFFQGAASQGDHRDRPDRPHAQQQEEEAEEGAGGSVTERDSLLGRLLNPLHSSAERRAWESYFVKTPRWGGSKPKRNLLKGEASGKTNQTGTVGKWKQANLAKACRIFLTREYNAVFLYIYMLTFVLRRNKLQSDRINEYVLFFIVDECVRGFIGVCEDLGCGAQGQRGERCLVVEEKEDCEGTEMRNEDAPPTDAIAFFSYLFDQIIFFVININSHRRVQRVCKQLLSKYRTFQVKLVRPPLIGLLKSMTETYSLLNNNCHTAEKRIKKQIESYTLERRKGLVVDLHVDHTHPFNTKLCSHSKQGKAAARQQRHGQQANQQPTQQPAQQAVQAVQPVQPSQPAQQEQTELLPPEMCTDGAPLGDALWLSKCEHDHHFSCSKRCHLCGASEEQSRKSLG